MTPEELKKLKQQLRASGVKEGSAKWQKAINKGYYGGNREHGYTGTETTSKKSSSKVKRENPNEYTIQGLLWLLRDYIKNGKINDMTNHRVDEHSAKLIQKYLLGRGYDLGYVDDLGNYRKDGFSADGRIGDKTIEFLNQEIAALKGSQSNDYENDFRAAYNGSAPTYNKVAGRTPQDILLLSNLYYNYYKQNPTLYAGLLDNPVQAAAVLPYLSDEAKSLLSKLAMESYEGMDAEGNPTGRVLNTPEMAYQGLLGSRGTELLRGWEKQNVANAKDRGLQDILLVVGGDVLGSGLKLMGQLTGGSPEDIGGLTYDYTYNPVTRQMQKVAVPNKTATVADNIGINDGSIGGTIGSFVVNTLTDPLTWATVAAAGDWSPKAVNLVKVASKPGSAYRGTLIDVNSGIPLNGGYGEIGIATKASPGVVVPGSTTMEGTLNYELAKGGYSVPGKPNYHIQGNRVNGVAARKSGGANKIISTSEPTTRYIKPEYDAYLSDVTITETPSKVYGPIYDYRTFPYTVEAGWGKATPYVAQLPGMSMYYLPNGYTYTPGFGFMPAFRGSSPVTAKPEFVSEQPMQDYVSGSYVRRPVGYNYVIKNLDDGKVIYDAPSSNTHNRFRNPQPSHRFLPVYWKGNYTFK